MHARRSRKFISAEPAHDGMMLLIFAATLNWRFRFVSTVTILQQSILRCEMRSTAAGASRAAKTKETPSDSQRVPDAKELGRRWRFFPTYAEV
jgi:hypothetical protein